MYLKFPATTSRERLLRNHWDLGAHGGGKECLSETSRPGFISTVSPVEFLVHELCFRGLYMNFSMEGLVHEQTVFSWILNELFKKKNKFERIPANHLSEKQNAIKAFTAEGFRRNG